MASERARIKEILHNRGKAVSIEHIYKSLRVKVPMHQLIDILDDFVALEVVTKSFPKGVAHYKINIQKKRPSQKEVCVYCGRPTNTDDDMCDDCIKEFGERLQRGRLNT